MANEPTTRAEVSIDTATFMAMVALVFAVLLLSAVLFRPSGEAGPDAATPDAARVEEGRE